MPRDELRAELRRELVDVAAVCTALGLERSKEERAKWTCPRHGGASLSVRIGRDRTMQVRCFGCDLGGSVFDLIAEAHDLDPRRDFRKVLGVAAELAGRVDLLDILEGRTPRPRPPPKPAPPPRTPAAERDYPPVGEVAALWAASGFTACDRRAREYLATRGLDAERVDDLSLARVIDGDVRLPRWARFGGRSWLETGHRLLVPAYDANGAMRSLRASRIVVGESPKRLTPAGHRATGLVFSCPMGRALLAGERDGWPSSPLRIVVAEGEPDFLTWATRFSDADETAPIVLGVFSGSWTAELAARVPDAAHVVVRTDADEAGNAYAFAILESLSPRCEVVRPRAHEAAA